MKRKIIRVGTSAAIIIPKELLHETNAAIGDEVEVTLRKANKDLRTAQVDPDVIEWTNRFIEEDRDLLMVLKDA